MEETPVAAVITSTDSDEEDESCCDCTCDPGAEPPLPVICTGPYEIKVGEGQEAVCTVITCPADSVKIPADNGTDPYCEVCPQSSRPDDA